MGHRTGNKMIRPGAKVPFVIPTGANPDFLRRGTTHIRVYGFR
jgi:uncharacterized protein with von Willebrand factor type A (vWA) domain